MENLNSTTDNQEEETQNQNKEKAIATDLNICDSTARLYEIKIEEGQEALNLPKSKINYIQREISQNVVNIVTENNAITLHGIQANLGKRRIESSLSTIYGTLKNKNFIIKRIRKVPN
ncbi:hypothetical protein RF11_16448 [Thelohanellus kitauei]|uniref:Uncharacterized protein n=1 Tax=Thelohanellus kitauei TaxID=669202 RepID=A0A0C2M295_THEKT|nr:hypothetical protein RF11_16448 [Thelohanellus kitauei]